MKNSEWKISIDKTSISNLENNSSEKFGMKILELQLTSFKNYEWKISNDIFWMEKMPIGY